MEAMLLSIRDVEPPKNTSLKIILLSSIFVIILVSYLVYSTFLPQYEEAFISMAILGKDQSLGGYYPGVDPTIRVNESVSWYIRLYNHLPDSQNVIIKIKLLNSTHTGPEFPQCRPSPEPTILTLRYSLEKNQTVITPFVWYLSEVRSYENIVEINELVVNFTRIPVTINSVDGLDFRMVFELWVFDNTLNDYAFVRTHLGTNRCVWNQLRFNVAS